MANYDEKTVAELKDEAKSRDLSGYSSLNRDELVKFLSDNDAEGDGSPTLGADSEASDANDPNVTENLSPEGQEALAELGEVEADQADLALDASGPLHLEKPSERILAGAASPEEAKEQEELIGELPEDHVGNIRGDGFVPERDGVEREGSGPNGEIVQEDVIDFPSPIADVEGERKDAGDGKKATVVNAPYVNEDAAREAFPDEGETVAQYRVFNQRAQLYTDGLSGQADHNTALAYRVPDVLPKSATETEASEDTAKSDEDDLSSSTPRSDAQVEAEKKHAAEDQE